ncbi:hypothetical protein SAMN05443249_3803 [Beijerinckia sp. 28-YEA-48]|nr:hypothetical protein SAMN05443249_3803 [Beijerinckia sp. 28-YEA-48]
MICTGSQVKAARAMIGMGQRELAREAGCVVNTVVGLEASDAVKASYHTVAKVQRVLESRGVVFIGLPQPGVKFARWPAPKASPDDKAQD